MRTCLSLTDQRGYLTLQDWKLCRCLSKPRPKKPWCVLISFTQRTDISLQNPHFETFIYFQADRLSNIKHRFLEKSEILLRIIIFFAAKCYKSLGKVQMSVTYSVTWTHFVAGEFRCLHRYGQDIRRFGIRICFAGCLVPIYFRQCKNVMSKVSETFFLGIFQLLKDDTPTSSRNVEAQNLQGRSAIFQNNGYMTLLCLYRSDITSLAFLVLA